MWPWVAKMGVVGGGLQPKILYEPPHHTHTTPTHPLLTMVQGNAFIVLGEEPVSL
jgi:hypothetical protein